jgi:hypothetical protein
MSPVKLEVLLHYYYQTCSLYRMRSVSPSHIQATEDLVIGGYLTFEEDVYCITQRGDAYVKAICNVPEPIQQWVVEL